MLVNSMRGSLVPTAPAAQAHTAAPGSADAAARSQSAQSSFDKLSLSPEPVGERRFQLELVSRISRDVRTASTPASELEALRLQVQSGDYAIDAMDIAAKLLLLNGEDA